MNLKMPKANAMRYLFLGSAQVLVALVLVAGCGSSGPAAPKVTGSVTLDGKPLSDATVRFVPEKEVNKGGGNSAKTDAEGKFQVQRDPLTKMTLKPGRYKVVITKWTDKKGNVPPEEEKGMLEAANELKNAIPPKYNSLDSGLAAEIKEGDNPLPPFQLKSK